MITTLTHKLIAFLMSLYVFFAGIPYGDEPVTVDFTATTDKYEYQLGEKIIVDIEGENVGRPFIGEKRGYNPNVSFSKETDGKKVVLKTSGEYCPAESVFGIIKHGEKFHYYGSDEWIAFESETGVYNMKVTVYGCTKVYENAIVVK